MVAALLRCAVSPNFIRHDARVPAARLAALVGLAAFWLACSAGASDWPTYMHDVQRSGVTPDSISTNLAPAWVYPKVKPPVAAWPDEAKKDSYLAIPSQQPFKTRLVFDHVNHVALAGNFLFAGSVTEHTIQCFEATTGELKWTFFTDAPVRMAPTFDGGRVFAGSDDGSVYCLGATNGLLLWKYTPAGTNNYLVPNNGHFASPWAVRTGVAVESGVAYFAAGIFPHDGMYLCAVDAATGLRTATNHWQTICLSQGSFQGYLLLSPTRVFVPGSRSNPFYFDRRNGALLGQYSDQNALGTFTLLASNSLFWGPSARGGAQITEGNLTGANLTTLPGANALVATTNRLFCVTDTNVRALDRTTRAVLWSAPGPYPYALVLVGATLLAGGDNEVAAFDAASGSKLWSARVEGCALGLAVANGRLYVSTDQGFIHAFAPVPAHPSTLILF